MNEALTGISRTESLRTRLSVDIMRLPLSDEQCRRLRREARQEYQQNVSSRPPNAAPATFRRRAAQAGREPLCATCLILKPKSDSGSLNINPVWFRVKIKPDPQIPFHS